METKPRIFHSQTRRPTKSSKYPRQPGLQTKIEQYTLDGTPLLHTLPTNQRLIGKHGQTPAICSSSSIASSSAVMPPRRKSSLIRALPGTRQRRLGRALSRRQVPLGDAVHRPVLRV